MTRIGCKLCSAKYRINGQKVFKIPNALNRYVFETQEEFLKHLRKTHGLLLSRPKVNIKKR